MFFLRPVHRYIVPCFPHVCTGFPPSSQKFSLLTNCVCGLNQGTKVRFHHWITNGVFKYNLSTYNSVKSQTPRPRTLTITYMYLSSPLMCWTTPFLKKTLGRTVLITRCYCCRLSISIQIIWQFMPCWHSCNEVAFLQLPPLSQTCYSPPDSVDDVTGTRWTLFGTTSPPAMMRFRLMILLANIIWSQQHRCWTWSSHFIV